MSNPFFYLCEYDIAIVAVAYIAFSFESMVLCGKKLSEEWNAVFSSHIKWKSDDNVRVTTCHFI
jgi:hypothetical protein